MSTQNKTTFGYTDRVVSTIAKRIHSGWSSADGVKARICQQLYQHRILSVSEIANATALHDFSSEEKKQLVHDYLRVLDNLGVISVVLGETVEKNRYTLSPLMLELTEKFKNLRKMVVLAGQPDVFFNNIVNTIAASRADIPESDPSMRMVQLMIVDNKGTVYGLPQLYEFYTSVGEVNEFFIYSVFELMSFGILEEEVDVDDVDLPPAYRLTTKFKPAVEAAREKLNANTVPEANLYDTPAQLVRKSNSFNMMALEYATTNKESQEKDLNLRVIGRLIQRATDSITNRRVHGGDVYQWVGKYEKAAALVGNLVNIGIIVESSRGNVNYYEISEAFQKKVEELKQGNKQADSNYSSPLLASSLVTGDLHSESIVGSVLVRLLSQRGHTYGLTVLDFCSKTTGKICDKDRVLAELKSLVERGVLSSEERRSHPGDPVYKLTDDFIKIVREVWFAARTFPKSFVEQREKQQPGTLSGVLMCAKAIVAGNLAQINELSFATILDCHWKAGQHVMTVDELHTAYRKRATASDTQFELGMSELISAGVFIVGGGCENDKISIADFFYDLTAFVQQSNVEWENILNEHPEQIGEKLSMRSREVPQTKEVRNEESDFEKTVKLNVEVHDEEYKKYTSPFDMIAWLCAYDTAHQESAVEFLRLLMREKRMLSVSAASSMININAEEVEAFAAAAIDWGVLASVVKTNGPTEPFFAVTDKFVDRVNILQKERDQKEYQLDRSRAGQVKGDISTMWGHEQIWPSKVPQKEILDVVVLFKGKSVTAGMVRMAYYTLKSFTELLEIDGAETTWGDEIKIEVLSFQLTYKEAKLMMEHIRHFELDYESEQSSHRKS